MGESAGEAVAGRGCAREALRTAELAGEVGGVGVFSVKADSHAGG